jgi:hypothetical protein
VAEAQAIPLRRLVAVRDHLRRQEGEAGVGVVLMAQIFLKAGEGVEEEEQRRRDLATLAGEEAEAGAEPKYSLALLAAAGFCPAQKEAVEGEAGELPHLIRYLIVPFLTAGAAGPFALSWEPVVARAISSAERQVALPVHSCQSSTDAEMRNTHTVDTASIPPFCETKSLMNCSFSFICAALTTKAE